MTTYIWVGAKYNPHKHVNLLSGVTGVHNTGEYAHGKVNWVSQANYWNVSGNWKLRVQHGASGYGLPSCGATGGGAPGEHMYVDTPYWPGHPSGPNCNATFESLPHAPQDGLCDGPYPKSECLFGGPSGGSYRKGSNPGGFTDLLGAIDVLPSYFSASQETAQDIEGAGYHRSGGCTGAPLQRLRLGKLMPGGGIESGFSYWRPTGGAETQGGYAAMLRGEYIYDHNGAGNPQAPTGYAFKGLSLRARDITINTDQTKNVYPSYLKNGTDYDLDQTEVVLADPYNHTRSFYDDFGEFTIKGQGNFYIDASKSLTGSNTGMPHPYFGSSTPGDYGYQGDGLHSFIIDGYESGDRLLTDTQDSDPIRVNKSMKVQFKGQVKRNVYNRSDAIESLSWKQSTHYLAVHPQGFYSTTSTKFVVDESNQNGRHAVKIQPSYRFYGQIKPSVIATNQSKDTVLSEPRFLIEDNASNTTGSYISTLTLFAPDGTSGIRPWVDFSNAIPYDGSTGGWGHEHARRTFIRELNIGTGAKFSTNQELEGGLFMKRVSFGKNSEIDLTEGQPSSWIEILGKMGGTTQGLPFGMNPDGIGTIDAVSGGLRVEEDMQSGGSIKIPADYFVSLHPRWNGTTGDVRRGLPTDPDKPVGGFGAGFSSSAGGKG